LSLSAQIERLLGVLGERWPATLECFRPGLSEGEIHDLIDQYFPALGHDLPQDFVTWWSYQDGYDKDRVTRARAAGHTVADSWEPTTGGRFSSLSSHLYLRQVASDEAEEREWADSDATWPTYPIAETLGGGTYGLWRRTPEDIVRIWFRDKVEGWETVPQNPRNESQTPTFIDWLTALNDAVQAERLILTSSEARFGSIKRARPTPLGVQDGYPWPRTQTLEPE